MTEAADSAHAQGEPDPSTSESPRARWPKIMIAITILVLLGRVIVRSFQSEIDDFTGLGSDVTNVISMVSILLMFPLWALCVLLLSRSGFIRRAIIASVLLAIPVAFFLVLRPVNGGDIDFLRFEPIWAQRPEAPPADEKPVAAKVDLSAESPSDFARFLGPDQNGIVDFDIDAEKFPTGCETVWKRPIGLGWSAFSIRGGYAVTMEQRGENECVTCYSVATGELAWIYQHKHRHRDAMNIGRTGPRSTPTIHQGNVYASGANGNFVCLDGATGEVRWQKDLNEMLGVELNSAMGNDDLAVQFEGNTSLAWGRSGAPLIVGDTVVIPGGGAREGDKATLLAFNKDTGESVWRGGDEMIAYGSPSLATIAGKEQILITAESKAMGFDPTDGTVLWAADRPGQSDNYSNTSPLTVVSSNQVLTTKGYPDGGGELFEITRDKEQFTATSVWNNGRVLRTKLTNPVILENYAYCISNGFLECTDLSDGTRAWKHRGRFGHGQILLINGGYLLIHSESGVLHLGSISADGYEETGTFKTIEGVCWNTISLSGPNLLVRSEIEAACIRLPQK